MTIMRIPLSSIKGRLVSFLSLAFTSAVASAAKIVPDTAMQAAPNGSNIGASDAQAVFFLSNLAYSDAAVLIARGPVARQAITEVEQWLSQFGTARNIIDVYNSLSQKSSFLDFLVSLYDFADLLAPDCNERTFLMSSTNLRVRQTAMTLPLKSSFLHCFSSALSSTITKFASLTTRHGRSSFRQQLPIVRYSRILPFIGAD